MSVLGSIFKGIAGAIPVVGPIISGIAGNAAGGMAKGREAENQQAMSRDQLLNQQYGIGQNAQMDAGQLDLQRKNFTEDARGGRAKQALLASLLGGGFQPTQVSVPGVKNATVSGGLAESLKNPGAQASMQELMKQALAAQMHGDSFEGGKVLVPPTLSQPKQSGFLEKVLGGVGLAGSLASGVGSALQKNPIQSAPGLGYGSIADSAIPGSAAPDQQSVLADILKKMQQYTDAPQAGDGSNR